MFLFKILGKKDVMKLIQSGQVLFQRSTVVPL